MDRDELRDSYVKWLMGLVGLGDEYSMLAQYLFRREFYWSENTPHDENRAIYGKNLRREFLDDEVMDEFGPCRVLEMLVALAINCEKDIMQDDIYGDRTPLWFMEFLKNLNLEIYTNNNKAVIADLWTDVDRVMDVWLGKHYKKNGEGGLFPMPKVKNLPDQREVEIWYQLNSWLEIFEQEG